MDVPGTQISAVDTVSGESLTFTTTPDRAAELQRRVHGMADMHNQHHAAGGMMGGSMHEGMMGNAGAGGTMGGSMHEGMMGHAGAGGTTGGTSGMMMPPPSHTAVVDLPNGARVDVTPEAPADLERLQSAVRQHAQHMQQSGCGMMHHPQGS